MDNIKDLIECYVGKKIKRFLKYYVIFDDLGSKKGEDYVNDEVEYMHNIIIGDITEHRIVYILDAYDKTDYAFFATECANKNARWKWVFEFLGNAGGKQYFFKLKIYELKYLERRCRGSFRYGAVLTENFINSLKLYNRLFAAGDLT